MEDVGPGCKDGGARAPRWRYPGTKMAVPGHEDGVVQEVLEDLAVLGLLLLRLLLSFGFGTSAARPFLPAAHLGLGVLRHLLDVDGAVGVLPDGDFVCSEESGPVRAKLHGLPGMESPRPRAQARRCRPLPTDAARPPPHLWSSSCAGTGSCPGAGAASARCSSSGCRWAGRAGSTSRSAEKRSLRPRGHPGGWKELGGGRGRIRKCKEAESQAARHSAQTHQSVTGTGHGGEHRHKTPTEPPFPTVLLSLYSICSQGISAVTNMTEQSTATGGGGAAGVGRDDLESTVNANAGPSSCISAAILQDV